MEYSVAQQTDTITAFLLPLQMAHTSKFNSARHTLRPFCHDTHNSLTKVYTNFPKICEPRQNSTRMTGDIKQVPTNIRRHRTDFSRHGDRATGICTPSNQQDHIAPRSDNKRGKCGQKLIHTRVEMRRFSQNSESLDTSSVSELSKVNKNCKKCGEKINLPF